MTVANVSEEALLLAVERAMDAHLFAQTLENERLHFTHALIREVLYVGISPRPTAYLASPSRRGTGNWGRIPILMPWPITSSRRETLGRFLG